MIPPSGWQFGFPKVLPDDWELEAETLEAWLVKNGYSQALVDKGYLKYCRYWKAPIETLINRKEND